MVVNIFSRGGEDMFCDKEFNSTFKMFKDAKIYPFV